MCTQDTLYDHSSKPIHTRHNPESRAPRAVQSKIHLAQVCIRRRRVAHMTESPFKAHAHVKNANITVTISSLCVNIAYTHTIARPFVWVVDQCVRTHNAHGPNSGSPNVHSAPKTHKTRLRMHRTSN